MMLKEQKWMKGDIGDLLGLRLIRGDIGGFKGGSVISRYLQWVSEV